jgi:outer membrane lipoprotein-sorting protein
MKRINIFLVAGALLVTASIPATPATPNGRVDEVLGNMQKAAANIKTIYARLEQNNKNGEIGGTERYRGEIFFKHIARGSDRVRINYEIPAGQTVVVNDKEIILHQKAINQCHITARNAVGQRNQEFAFFATPYSLTSAQIKARYEIAHVGDETVDGVSTAVLELTPKVKSSVKKMKWWIDRGSWLPIKSEVVEQNRSVSTFILKDTRINDSKTSAQFDYKCPDGSKIVRH